MMKLHWSSRSPFVRKVMIVVHELGLAAEVETVRTLVHSSKANPDYLPVNPVGKIPALVTEDGTVLYDSRVIAEYLDTTFGGSRLIPASGPARWRALTHQALADGIMETDILWLLERAREPAMRSEALIATCRTKIASATAALERDEAFLEGAFAIGQIAATSALAHLDFRFPDDPWRPGRPKLAAWFAAMAKRPSVTATAFVDQP